ncbi:MAG: hypothetical protein CMB56_003190 [Methanobacteriota archaeon]|nr:MAG: hypothetical protein CMB56_003190 [Euryarchaeota archaeon]|tara:strand:- start:5549 stop:6490 length:942 start_codon:yes stop_codon:yes gene_type:complete
MRDRVVLIIVSGSDIASVNQGNELLKKCDWDTMNPVEGFKSWRLGSVRLWWRDGWILNEDNLDYRWEKETREVVTEVIFPSRHVASSGTPSLTIHPIGTFQYSGPNKPPFGGRPGDGPPPSLRMSSWMTDLKKKVEINGIKEEFSVSFETTHHGPWLNSPSLFIEIGSTEDKWGNSEAASVLADVIIDGLNLNNNSPVPSIAPKKVVFCLGGGHYAPQPMRLCDLGLTIGHMLANYALKIERDPSSKKIIDREWENVILSAYKSTQRASPESEIWAYIDKKSFKGWQRKEIRDFLSKNDIPLGRSADLITSET